MWLDLTDVSLVWLQIEVAHKYSTVDTLRQQYVFIPAKYKDCYLAFVLNELSGSTAMVSDRTRASALNCSAGSFVHDVAYEMLYRRSGLGQLARAVWRRGFGQPAWLCAQCPSAAHSASSQHDWLQPCAGICLVYITHY